MPRRDDLHKILIIGSGPIVIGQACEFDYSGTQACKVLADEGYEVVLVNSNPATIMTDPDFAARTYIEPLDLATLTRVIEIERPDALLPTLGGQTALNLAIELKESGILDLWEVEMIGADADAIRRAEDRQEFRTAMEEIGLRVPRSVIATSPADVERAANDLGLPLVVRPAFTMGGAGGGIAHDREGLRHIAENGLRLSPIGQVMLEESVAGWHEFELEVMRDRADNVVIICSIENVDPMGVHTGDSVTVAPALTLTDGQYQELRDAARKIIRKIGVDTGGSNVQFAVRARHRRGRGHRDEPARVAQLRPGVARRPASRSPRSPPSWPWATRSTRSPTTSRARRRRASSRRSTTSSSRCRAGPSRSSPWPTPSSPRT